ncbi:MAG: glucose 1-dehydrogenase [Gaiellaceae bacterium]|nr:glucose 1-dehydrogenase [Gaiellaceae bacterium]
MQALVTEPGKAGTARIEEVAEPVGSAGDVLVRVVEVGVCGTDREIIDGRFGAPPEGRETLVLGHELLGVVAADGHGFARGDLVAATVRRSCGQCAACAAGSPDACLTGRYTERGITALDGFASELVAERPEHLVPVPARLASIGVLSEPTSVGARAVRHARIVGDRQTWRPARAIVLGTGAIGMLSALQMRLEGLEVWVTGHRPPDSQAAALVEGLGARYVRAEPGTIEALAAEVHGFDLVLEATGDAQAMASTVGLLARSGVAVLLGIDGRARDVAIDGRVLGTDFVLGNRALIGSVNARGDDWHAAVDALDRAWVRFGDVVEQFVGLRVPPGRFEDALAFRGIKAALRFGA